MIDARRDLHDVLGGDARHKGTEVLAVPAPHLAGDDDAGVLLARHLDVGIGLVVL